MISITAYMNVKPEYREVFLEKVQQVVELTREEEGNVSYRLFEEVSNSNQFVMLEQWKDQHAIDVHNRSEHFQTFFASAKKILAEPLTLKRFINDDD
ncbi:antibiotic biosynthesis monooxygenase [Metabacillus sp. KIGAM252]|uniref:Antibiotic biosynthesis monooxygenase n=1 Tax=Metabacillus flavus TaxID=2823519 RepID=A0ABS5LF55_9BACI|nr:putative quinol monooxygenase [Metabacillus flavus]MBS2969218.1 antibiotic biosynthesis monooxygenase [Metabacillus flavus]